jgi:hypothetical protein
MSLNASLQDGLERSIGILNQHPLKPSLEIGEGIFGQPVLQEWSDQILTLVPEGVSKSQVHAVVIAVAPSLLGDSVPDHDVIKELGYFTPGYSEVSSLNVRLAHAIVKATKPTSIMSNPTLRDIDTGLLVQNSGRRGAIQRLASIVIGSLNEAVPFSINYFHDMFLTEKVNLSRMYNHDGSAKELTTYNSYYTRPETYVHWLSRAVQDLAAYLNADITKLGYRGTSDDFGLGHHVKKSARP